MSKEVAGLESDVREKEAERSGLGVEVGPGECYTREGEEEKGREEERQREKRFASQQQSREEGASSQNQKDSVP